jgi:hypothetical protein
VSVWVIASGSGWVAMSASANSGPCWEGRPAVLGARGGGGEENTRSPAKPAEQLHGHIGQQQRQAGHVVAGVEDDEDVRVPGLVLSGLLESLDHLA